MSAWSSWDQDKGAPTPTIGNCQVLEEMARVDARPSCPKCSVRGGTPHSHSHLTGQSTSQGCIQLPGSGDTLTCLGGAYWGRHMVPARLGDCAGAEEEPGALVRNDSRTKLGWVCFILDQVEFVSELPKTVTGKIKRSDLRNKEFGQMESAKASETTVSSSPHPWLPQFPHYGEGEEGSVGH